MSTVTTTMPPAIAPVLPERAPRRLEAVAPVRRRRPRRMYGVIAVAGVVAIGAAQMGMSILSTQASYEKSALNRELKELTYQKQILTDDVAGLSSPQYLAANAAALGMVIDESPNYLRLSDGAVLGAGGPAAGASAVDALGRAAVPNALIAETGLIAGGAAAGSEDTMTADAAAASAAAGVDAGTDAATPPPITDGLPVPRTH